MPLIILSGLPSSGKSTRAEELCEYFKQRSINVILLSENEAIPKAGYNKNDYYCDSQKEKIIRADLKSETIRLLNKNDVIILDGGNYIKGYRYEIHCATKSARVSQCTLYCAITKEDAWKFNQKRFELDNIAAIGYDRNHTHPSAAIASSSTGSVGYKNDVLLSNTNVPYNRDVFEALCQRFEEPLSNNRWDSPMFTIFPGDRLKFDEIFDALFVKKPPPPNQSTQNPPLSATNYLYELDKITQELIQAVISSRKVGIPGPITVKSINYNRNGLQLKSNLKIMAPDNITPSQLNRMRRQFINYSKMHTSNQSLDKAPELFVQFLNSNF